MVQVKDAVKLSLVAFNDLFPDDVHRDLRLEEVNLDEKSNRWEVTVSYKNPDYDEEVAARKAGHKSMDFLLGRNSNVPSRYYKTIRVKAEDGALVGIKNERETFEN